MLCLLFTGHNVRAELSVDGHISASPEIWLMADCYNALCSITCTHVSQDGCTALYLAAQQGHEDVVELLLEAKADPELKNVITPFACAQQGLSDGFVSHLSVDTKSAV